MFKKILVAVDGSKNANRAVDAAVDLATRYQASALLLHVIRNMSLPQEIWDMISAGEVTESRLEILQDSAEIILENAREKFQQAGITDAQSHYLIGNPAPTIARYAKDNDVDLIIIGQRGVSSELEIMGSIARKLVNIAPTSCLVIK